MADPSDAQLNTLNTAQEVANYVGFDGVATEAESMRGSFFLLLGLTGTTQVATLGNASEQDFDAAIAGAAAALHRSHRRAQDGGLGGGRRLRRP